MKKFAAAIFAIASISAHAYCTGDSSSAFRSCTDSSGNSYNVQRYGNTTYTNGYNSSTGNSWSQTSQSYGSTTYHNGTAANGNSWSGTTQNIGNAQYYNGTDSRGNRYSGSSWGR